MSEIEPELQPHYNTSAAYFPGTKDFVVTTATDKGIVKILDRHKKTTVASFKDANPGSGGGIYSVGVAKRVPHQPHHPLAGSMGERAPVAPPNRFAISNRSNIMILDFQK